MTEKKQINVLHIIETLDIGGAECVVADIVNNLPGNIKPLVCCFKHTGEMANRIKPGVDVFSLAKGEGNSLFFVFRLAKIMREKNIHAIHTHNWGVFCESIFAAVLAKVPVRVHMAHGGLLAHQNSCWGSVKKKIRRLTEFTAALFCNDIIAVSGDLKKIICQEVGIAEHKITVVRNGIKLTSVDAATQATIYKQLGLNKNEFIICFVGRLATVKNVPFLLAALEEIYVDNPAVKLLVVGDGPEKNTLIDLVNKRGMTESVFFLGARNDIRNILSICDLFVLPSLSEGISISLLEAMSMKVPAIATNVGGNAEVIENGETGILVESNNVGELKAAIYFFMNNKERKEEIAEKAYHRMHANFNIEKNIEIFSSMYQI